MTERRYIFLILSLALYAIALVAVQLAVTDILLADTATLYVAPGSDCGGATPCFASVQDAVDAADDGDTVKVAQGIYTVALGSQVVNIFKPITITGGYTNSDWLNPDADLQPAVIDAEDADGRRGIGIRTNPGDEVILENLTVKNGNVGWGREGGGLYVIDGDASLRNVTLSDNLAQNGCGVYSAGGALSLSQSRILSNTCRNEGYSALYLTGSGLRVTESVVAGNDAGGIGCRGSGSMPATGLFVENLIQGNAGTGIDLSRCACVVRHNTIASSGFSGVNVSSDAGVEVSYNHLQDNSGAGISVSPGTSTARLIGNTVVANRGGGIKVSASRAELSGNMILSNTVEQQNGAGVSVKGGSTVIGENDVVANNLGPWGGVYVEDSAGQLTASHWTVVGNGDYGFYSNDGTVALTNTIVASHTLVGLWGNFIRADHTLFSGNAVHCAPGVWCTNSIVGVVGFVDPASRDYHLGLSSAAIDAGIDAGVAQDIDGDPRPQGSGDDVGADETGLAVSKSASAAAALGGELITYTLSVTNT